MTDRPLYSGPVEHLRTMRDGSVKFHAVTAHRAGQKMLSVYGWVKFQAHIPGKGFHVDTKTLLNRMLVPNDTPKDECMQLLQGLCDITAVRLGVRYSLKRAIK